MRWPLQVVALTLLIVAGWLGMQSLQPPAVVPATAPDTVFSAERAMAELRPIAMAPHALGSDEHEGVLIHLVDRLKAAGFDVAIQGATGFNTLGGVPRGAAVKNIVARRQGTASTGALLLMAHYDAVPRSLGAGDDGSGVATLLETVRALEHTPLRNDLIVLLSDGEEAGLLGAEAFVDLHPRAKDVRLVLNFDSRGDRGPVALFETSPNASRLIRVVSEQVRHPLATSLAAAVYRLLPNDTDLSIFLHANRGYGALNFAMIGGFQNYHAPTDDLLHLDVRAVQNLGDYALPLTRAFAHAPLDSLAGEDVVYFPVPGLGLSRYGHFGADALAVLLLVGVVLFAVVARRHGLFSWQGGLWGTVATAMTIVVPTLACWAGWRAVLLFHPEYGAILQGEPYNAAPYLVGFAALAVTLGIAMHQMFVTRLQPLDLAIPGFMLWAVLALVTTLRLPGASYLFAWPLLFALLGAAWWLAGVRKGTRRPVGVALSVAPAIWLFVPLIRLFETAMTMQFIPVLALLMMLVLSLSGLAIVLIGHTWRVALPLGLLIGVAGIVKAEMVAGFSPAARQPDSLVYLADLDMKAAWWVTYDRQADPFTRQVLGDSAQPGGFAKYQLWRGLDQLLSAAAPLDAEEAPATVQVVDDHPVAGGRRLHLHIGASGRVESWRIFAEDSTLRIRDVILDGRALPPATPGQEYAPTYREGPGGLLLLYEGMPAPGADLTFTVATTAPLVLRVEVTRDGLPSGPHGALEPRSASLVAKPFLRTDVSIVSKRFRL